MIKTFVFLLNFISPNVESNRNIINTKVRRNTKFFSTLNIGKHAIDFVGPSPALMFKCVFKRLANQESLPYPGREYGEKSLEVARLKCLFPT